MAGDALERGAISWHLKDEQRLVRGVHLWSRVVLAGKVICVRPCGQSEPGWVLKKALGRQEAGGDSRDRVTKGLRLES